MGAVHRQRAVAEAQSVHGFGQARGELVSDRSHPQASPLADASSEVDPGPRGQIHGCGRGEGEAQPLVDRGADVAGLSADAGPWQQNGVGAVLGAEGFAQRPGAG
ncbi:hypothetical protein ABZ070_31115 [Streptomyces sp. NPDC006283]|uniref:hypothetical protein n=1 Tax=Streptomyces sp. NPDC006283 TaxID=3156741 RepID=UPI0033BA97B2